MQTYKNLVGLTELVTESVKPIQWLIEDVYPVGEAVLMVGQSHAGKTYLALDQGLAVAYGLPWLGIYPTLQAPVIYAPSEGRTGIARRVAATMKYRYPYDPIPPKGDEQFHLFGDRLKLNGGKQEPTYRELAMMTLGLGAKLVIIDVLRDATPGISENSDEMGDAFGLLRDLAQDTDATVLVLHHLGKDASKGARGHSSIKDKTDIEVTLKAISRDTATQRRTDLVLETTKNRNYDSDGMVLVLKKATEEAIAPVVWAVDPSGDTGITYRETHLYYLAAIDKLNSGTGQGQGQTPVPTAAIAEVMGVVGNSAKETLKAMRHKGLVEIDKTGKAHRWTVTPEGRKATYRAPTGQELTGASPTGRDQHPLGAGPPVEDGRPTTVEVLLSEAKAKLAEQMQAAEADRALLVEEYNAKAREQHEATTASDDDPGGWKPRDRQPEDQGDE